MNELESIFRDKDESKKQEKGSGGASTPKERLEEHALIFEAIKVIELMSALNIEDFQMN